jgi:tripartite-type tricarboxylate transporter receptor subunit TctC
MVPQFKRDQELKTFLDEQEATLRKVAKEMKLIQ